MNPLDYKFRDRNAFNIVSRLPAILSSDVAGTVVSSGPSTTLFPPGTHVFSQADSSSPIRGGLQEYTLVDSRFAAIVPPNLTDDDAAVFPVNATTSALSLFRSVGLGLPFPGSQESQAFNFSAQKLLVIGDGTNCGKLVVHFVRLAGFGTIIVTASPTGNSELKSYGATHVIDRKATDVESRIRALVEDDLIYVIDTFNWQRTMGISLLSNSQKGAYVHLVSGQEDKIAVGKKAAGYESKQVIGASKAHPEFAVQFWKQLPKWLENGAIKQLKYEVIEGLDADMVNAALDGYKDWNAPKRWHVHPQGLGDLGTSVFEVHFKILT